MSERGTTDVQAPRGALLALTESWAGECVACHRSIALIEAQDGGAFAPLVDVWTAVSGTLQVCGMCLLSGLAIRLGADHLHGGGNVADLNPDPEGPTT